MFEVLGRVMTNAGNTQKLRCEACGHSAEMTRERSFAAFGVYASPFEIRHRARCGECRTRGQCQMWI